MYVRTGVVTKDRFKQRVYIQIYRRSAVRSTPFILSSVPPCVARYSSTSAHGGVPSGSRPARLYVRESGGYVRAQFVASMTREVAPVRTPDPYENIDPTGRDIRGKGRQDMHRAIETLFQLS